MEKLYQYVGHCQIMKDFLAGLVPGTAVPAVIADRKHPFYGHEIFQHHSHHTNGTIVTCELCLTQNEFWVRGQMTQKEYETYMAERAKLNG